MRKPLQPAYHLIFRVVMVRHLYSQCSCSLCGPSPVCPNFVVKRLATGVCVCDANTILARIFK